MNEFKRKYQRNLDKDKVNTEKKSNHSFIESKYINSSSRKEIVNKEFNKISNGNLKVQDTKNINYNTTKTINTPKTNYIITKVEKVEPYWRKDKFRNYIDEKEKKSSKLENISNKSNNIYINSSMKEEKKEKIPNVGSNKMSKTIVVQSRRSNKPEIKLLIKNTDDTKNTNTIKSTINANVSNLENNIIIEKKDRITTNEINDNISKKNQKKEEEKLKNKKPKKIEATYNFDSGKLIQENSKSKINDNKDPKILKCRKNLITDSFSSDLLDNTSLIVKTIDDLLLIIYPKEDNTIVCYNIINNQKVNEVRKTHDKPITNLRYYPDIINRLNLMLSLSSDDNNLKVWNIGNFQCILDLKRINVVGWIKSACFLNDNNQVYVLSSNATGFTKTPSPIQVFNLKGKLIKKINDSSINTYFIEYYYDNKSSKNYIITGNACFFKSYDYDKNQIYHKYNDNTNLFHISAIINFNGNKTNLIESCLDGKIRIWDFHSGLLLYKINVCDSSLYGICLWNNNYLMVGCEDTNIKIIDLDNKKFISVLSGHKNIVTMIRKLVHPKYGAFLVSQGYLNDGFKLWV